MAKEILIIKNVTHEGPGIIEIILREHNIPYTILDLSQSDNLPAVEQYGAVVVLGGPDSANDDSTKVQRARTLVKNALDQHIPYLGICLGLQLMVKVMGGTVCTSPVKEIGFKDPTGQAYSVQLTSITTPDPLFAGLNKAFRVFQLHGETVQLTPTMQLLGMSPLVKNQLVKIGNNAYGTQFHFELTPEMFEQWLQQDPDLLKLDKNILRLEFESIKADYTATGRQLFQNFLRIAGF